jgi:plastocyanin
MVDIGTVIIGTIVVLVAVGGFLFIYYSRANAVEKTGYGALIMLAIVSIMIPVFWLLQGSQQTDAKSSQHIYAVQSGMKLYAQYCILNCYTIKKDSAGKDQLIAPKYNGYTVDALNSMSDDQIRRIISAGMYAPNAAVPANFNNITRSQTYGGPLTDDDVEYLLQFVRSADPAYLKQNGYSGDSATNGFTQLIAYLQANSPGTYATALALGSTGQFGAPVDYTSKTAVEIDMVQTAAIAGQQCDSGCYAVLNAKVKVGTKITWVNKSNVSHTVTAIVGESTAAPKPAPQIFDSTLSKPIQTGGVYTYTVVASDFIVNGDHTLVYYCQIHANYMFAELTIVQ